MPRNSRNRDGRINVAQSAYVESSSVTDDSDVDIVTKNKYNSLPNTRRYKVLIIFGKPAFHASTHPVFIFICIYFAREQHVAMRPLAAISPVTGITAAACI